MPRYHAVIGCHAMGDGADGTMMKTSVRPGVVATYTWDKPIGAFSFPMDTMTRLPGHEDMTYDDMIAYLIGQEEYWWAARVFKNYNGLLDMYIQWASDSRVHNYVLDFDPLTVTIGEDHDGWPAPEEFFLARAALRTGTSWTIDEYNRFNEPPPVPMHPPTADEAPIGTGRPDTLEEAQVAAASAVTMEEMATTMNNAAEAHAPEAMTPNTAIESPSIAEEDQQL